MTHALSKKFPLCSCFIAEALKLQLPEFVSKLF